MSNNRPDFAKTQRDKQNQRRFLHLLEAARGFLKFDMSYNAVREKEVESKSYCPHIDERPLAFLKRCYLESNDSGLEIAASCDAENIAKLLTSMEECVNGTEEFEVENELYRALFIDESKASSFLQLRPNERAFSLFAQYMPFKDEPKLVRAFENIEIRFLRQYNTEHIYELARDGVYVSSQTRGIMRVLAPLSTITQSVQDVVKIMTDPMVNLTNQAPTVTYGENLLDTLREYLTALDSELWNNFSSIVEIRYSQHDEFSRRKRRLSSAVRNLQQTIAKIDGDEWLKALKIIGLTETDELVSYLRKNLMPESSFNVNCQYNPITKASEILTIMNAIWDRYLYWLMNDEKESPLYKFTKEIAKNA